MNRIFLSAAVMTAAMLLSFAPEIKAANAAEDAILELEQKWEDALIKSDVDALAKLYGDKIIYTHSSGKVDTKESYINAIKSGATRYQSMKRDDIKVEVYGEAAIVSCHWEVHILSQGNKVDINARYLHVYVQQKDGWKMVAHESTRISP